MLIDRFSQNISSFTSKYLTEESTSALFTLAGVSSYRGAQMLLQLGFVQLLTVNQYSEIFFILAIANGLSSFIGESVGLTLSRQLLTDHKLPRQTNKLSLLTATFAATLSAVLFVIIYYSSHKTSNDPFLIVLSGSILAFLNSLNPILQFILVSKNLAKKITLIQVCYAFALIAFLFTGITLSHRIDFIISGLATLAAGLAVAQISVWYSSNLNKIDPSFSLALPEQMEWIKSQFILAAPIAAMMTLGAPVHIICLSFLKASDRVDGTQMAMFGFSYLAFTVMAFLPGASGTVFVKYFSKTKEIVQSKNQFKRILFFYTKLGLPVLAIGLLLIPKIIEFLIPKYTNASTTMQILLVCGFLSGLTLLFCHYLNTKFKTQIFTVYLSIYAIFYLLLSFYFTDTLKLGSMGLSLAMLTALFIQVLGLIFHTFFNSKEIGS